MKKTWSIILKVIIAVAGAIVVVIKIDASCGPVVAAAPLNPYHPNQRMNNRRDFSRLFVFRYNKRVAFLKNALFCFVSCYLLGVSLYILTK